MIEYPRYQYRQPTRMVPRQPLQTKRVPNASSSKRKLFGFRQYLLVVIAVIFVVSFNLGVTRLASANSIIPQPEIRSGYVGYCIDDTNAHITSGTAVINSKCDGSSSQQWTVNDSSFRFKGGYCLSLTASRPQAGSLITLNHCQQHDNGQIWVHYMDGYQNPNTGLCLASPSSGIAGQLVADSCNDMSTFRESWTPAVWDGAQLDPSDQPCMQFTKGMRVACYAKRQWAAWQSGLTIHKALLSDYTEGNSYEEWCADFVSYVYRESGYPFTGGERNGWDEYDANNIQYMGFTMHDPQTYTPKPGDVAVFSYTGGHVEIVVSGGAHPAFIYGDAGTTDPATGNGNMAENSFTDDGTAGSLMYYLSPNI